jgi:hypothetical protein
MICCEIKPFASKDDEAVEIVAVNGETPGGTIFPRLVPPEAPAAPRLVPPEVQGERLGMGKSSWFIDMDTLYTKSGWWFGTFFIFPYAGNNHIFQRG